MVAGEPVLNPLRGIVDGLADIDRAEFERHRAGIDGGEIEDVVDEGEQRIGRGRDVVEVFGLLRHQRAGGGIVQKMREADDGGERRAQFVGDVVDEIDLHLVGGLQRLVALAQRALDVFGIGDVLEGQHGGAVGQRHGHAVQHAAVLALQLQRHLDPVLDRGDRFAERAPGGGVIEQRPAPGLDRLDMRLFAQRLGRQLPHFRKRRIEQLRAAVAAEHRDGFGKIVERFTLDPDQAVEAPRQFQALGDVVEQIGDAAFRVGRGDDADARGRRAGTRCPCPVSTAR